MSAVPSTRFPFISLHKALERAEKIYQSDKAARGMKMPMAFAAWDYSEKSSGGFQTVGALMGYGLLEDEGSKTDRVLRLTASARRYFQSEIEEDRADLRDRFARHPRLFAHLLEIWDEGNPPDPVARTYLKTEIKLNDQSARSALGIYKENLSFVRSKAGLKAHEPMPDVGLNGSNIEAEVTSISVEPPIAIKIGDLVQATIGGVDQFVVPRAVTNVFRDPARGWFVSIQGEKSAVALDQVTVEHPRPQMSHTEDEPINSNHRPSAKSNSMEVFMGANGRLQITANVDKEGVQKLKALLGKYEEILDMLN